MTDLEISKQLALAIGWREDQIGVLFGEVFIKPESRFFRYKDWNVIGPIAERYGLTVCFWEKIAWHPHCSPGHKGNTTQKAIALAVINGSKK